MVSPTGSSNNERRVRGTARGRSATALQTHAKWVFVIKRAHSGYRYAGKDGPNKMETERDAELLMAACSAVDSRRAVCALCHTQLLPLAEAGRAQLAGFVRVSSPSDLPSSLDALHGSVDKQTAWGYCGSGCGRIYCMECAIVARLSQCECGGSLWPFLPGKSSETSEAT